jgi:hypothetical protein
VVARPLKLRWLALKDSPKGQGQRPKQLERQPSLMVTKKKKQIFASSAEEEANIKEAN